LKKQQRLDHGSSVWKSVRRHYQLYLFLIPSIVYVFIFCYTPLWGIQIAFRDFKASQGISGSAWAGLKYFERFLSSPSCKDLFKNTLYLSFYSILAGFPLPIVLALFLNQCQNKRFKKVIQNITYAPYFISTVVLVGMLNLFMGLNGPIAKVVELLGGTADLYMGKPQYFRHVYVWSGVWQTVGWNSIIYIAALTSVPAELHEAAMLDGANKWQRIWHVDLPMIKPTIAVLLVLSLGGVLGVGYEKVYLMQNGMNMQVSEVISTYVYKYGLQKVDYSYSTAVGLFNNLINFILLLSVNKFSKKFTDSSLM